MRRIATGLALMAVLGACTEATRAGAPAPSSLAPPRAVVVTNGAVRVGTPGVHSADQPVRASGALTSPTPTGGSPRSALPGPSTARGSVTNTGQPSDTAAARGLAQAAPADRPKPGAAQGKPAVPPAAVAKAKPGQPDASAAAAEPTKDASPSPTPKPTMRPAHIPRRGARPVFAPGRTSFVLDKGRDGVGFYRTGELTPAPPVYARLQPPEPPLPDEEEFLEEELEEGTP